MSKTKSKTHSEVEHLRGLVRELKSVNRNLKKRIKELERREYFFDNKDLYKTDNNGNEENDEICKQCGKGVITTTDLLFFTIESCSICEYKEKKKKEDETGEEGS